MKHAILAASATLAFTAAAHADPIEGVWIMPSGDKAEAAACEAGYCLTYIDGEHAGKTFGEFAPTEDGKYEGEITDYTKKGKTYSGKGEVEGDTLSVAGCIMGGLICRSKEFARAPESETGAEG